MPARRFTRHVDDWCWARRGGNRCLLGRHLGMHDNGVVRWRDDTYQEGAVDVETGERL